MSEETNAVEEVVPLNLKAILDWCEKYRPDLRPVVWAERNNNGFILMITTGFEAGRHFQKDNPGFPLDVSPLYFEQAVVMKDPAACEHKNTQWCQDGFDNPRGPRTFTKCSDCGEEV